MIFKKSMGKTNSFNNQNFVKILKKKFLRHKIKMKRTQDK